MKRTILAVLMVFMTLSITGCGGGDTPRPTFVAQIISNPLVDGDIKLNFLTGALTVQQNPPTVLAGIDPFTNDEYRGFLHFTLTGNGGVPGNAVIVSAFLDLVINSIQPPNGTIPILIDLVSFQPPTLLTSDFNRTSLLPLLSTTIRPSISRTDVQQHVSVDVTTLMVEAQRRGLLDFQVRILEDFVGAPPGLIEIDDTTVNRAPLLTVTYF